MSDKNRDLFEFLEANDQQPAQEKEDHIKERYVCDYYLNAKKEYAEEIEKLATTMPQCGYCIEYLCEETSDGTLSSYSSSLRMFTEHIHEKGICIADVDYVDVRDYFESRKDEELATSTFQVIKSAISGAISRYEAERTDFPVVSWKISNNIDPDDYGVGTKYERDSLKDEEIPQLLAEADIRNQLMMLTTMETGPRAEATCIIKISDVDLNEGTIRLTNTKSGGKYKMPLTDNLASLLQHWINDIRSSYVLDANNPYLFPSKDGGKMSISSYLKSVHEAAERAGIQEVIGKLAVTGQQKECIDSDHRTKYRVDVHALRHTFSHLLKQNGVSKRARVYAMDHSRDVTDGYGVDEEACRKEIREKFDGIDVSEL